MNNEELAVLAKQGDKAATHQLWDNVYLLIYKLMGRYFKACPLKGLEPADLKQSGYFALIKAIEAYKPERETLFISYLGYHVQNIAHEQLGHGHRRKKDPILLSLNEPIRGIEDGGITVLDTLVDDSAAAAMEQVQEDVCRKQLHDKLTECFLELPENYANVLQSRFFENKTLREIAVERGVSRNAVCLMEKNALRKLRRPSMAQKLRPFLYPDDYSGQGLTAFRNRGFVSKVELHAELLVDGLD